MPQFILAFPMTKEVGEPLALTETAMLAADATSAIIPGCSVMFKVVRKEHVPGLADIFKEHQNISADAAAAIEAHKSLLFLLGEVKNIDEVTQVNMAILKVFNAGALGVYMQQCGAAWTDAGFREEVGDGENVDTMNRGREFPGERMTSVAQPQADPMAPLIYFSAGAGSALLAFLVFYLCLRFLPKRGCDCHQEKTSKKG